MEFTRADRKLSKLGFGKYNTDNEKESKQNRPNMSTVLVGI